MKFSLIGNGSWATAIAKIITDNGHEVHWWMRKSGAVQSLKEHHHNTPYLSSISFDPALVAPSTDLKEVLSSTDHIIFCVPSAYLPEILEQITPQQLHQKYIISAVKGILPKRHQLLSDYLTEKLGVSNENFVSITGPCHAEEIAMERLSYLTFSCSDHSKAEQIAGAFGNEYLHALSATDSVGTQYASVLKNVYALGAGIAHGLGYGDNFMSVYVTRCFEEMHQYLCGLGCDATGLIRSPYLGDLLVTCYSLHSRNRRLGSLLGQGYSLKASVTEMGMVAEGYYAAQGMHHITARQKKSLPVLEYIYKVLWEGASAADGFKKIESLLR